MKKTHGKSGTKIYKIWCDIKQRCFKPKTRSYETYGKLGITMQEDWVNDFKKFYDYVSALPKYNEKNLGRNGISIDRINNDGNYKEENLRWSTAKIQARNTKIKRSNTTGYRGVSHSGRGRYRSYISIDSRYIHLGIRSTAQEAYKLRVTYIKKHKLKGFEVS